MLDELQLWLRDDRTVGYLVLLAGFSMIFSLMHRGFVLARGTKSTTAAKVVEKWQDGKRCHAAFLTGGIVRKFQVSHSEYEKLQPGQKGQLTSQGERYVRFSTKK